VQARLKAEEDAATAAAEEAKAQRKREREASKRKKEAERRADMLERKRLWMEEASRDEWSQEQQGALENALLTAPMLLTVAGDAMRKEKEKKWNYVSRAVEGKNRNQCMARYRLLAQLVVDRKYPEDAVVLRSVEEAAADAAVKAAEAEAARAAESKRA
jgi:hypothetical protein